MKKSRKPNLGYIAAGAVAVVICIYIVLVSLSGMKDSNTEDVKKIKGKNHIPIVELESKDRAVATKPIKEILESDTVSLDDSDVSEILVNTGVDVDVIDSIVDSTMHKTVKLIDNNDTQFGVVCFEAASEEVFMSYGWVGLAKQALHHTEEDRDIDDIKIDLTNGCHEDLYPIVWLEQNPDGIKNTSILSDDLEGV